MLSCKPWVYCLGANPWGEGTVEDCILTAFSITVSNVILINHGAGSRPSVLFDRL